VEIAVIGARDSAAGHDVTIQIVVPGSAIRNCVTEAGGCAGKRHDLAVTRQVPLPVSVHCEGISIIMESPLNNGVRRTSRSIDVADIV
jgi:hypothetical protein